MSSGTASPKKKVGLAWSRVHRQEHEIVIGRSKIADRLTKKCSFCPTDREIDKTDVTGLLVSINVWNYMVIWCRSSCGFISDHRQKNSKRRGAARDSSTTRRPINVVNWLAFLQSLTHYFGRSNQKQVFGSYKSRVSWHLNHVTPPIMAIKGN